MRFASHFFVEGFRPSLRPTSSMFVNMFCPDCQRTLQMEDNQLSGNPGCDFPMHAQPSTGPSDSKPNEVDEVQNQ